MRSRAGEWLLRLRLLPIRGTRRWDRWHGRWRIRRGSGICRVGNGRSVRAVQGWCRIVMVRAGGHRRCRRRIRCARRHHQRGVQSKLRGSCRLTVMAVLPFLQRKRSLAEFVRRRQRRRWRRSIASVVVMLSRCPVLVLLLWRGWLIRSEGGGTRGRKRRVRDGRDRQRWSRQ